MAAPPPLIDPSFHDTLKVFFKPIKYDDPRLDFYNVYKREATEYDTDYVRGYDDDLNITLIFAGLFSTVSSALVIAVQPNLEPDPNDQSAAILRLILLTLNPSANLSEIPALPPIQENPPSEIVIVSGLMYASLLISLLAAFVAMLGKQWLNRYLRHAGGSIIERCGDRQLKHDGLQKWKFHLFLEALPVMLQIALFLLACGLCLWMVSINTPIAVVLITLTALGGLFYLVIAVAGASSYGCPFQTPASTVLRGICRNLLLLWKVVFATDFAIHRPKKVQSPTVLLEETREDLRVPLEPNSSPHNDDSSPHGINPPTHDTDPLHHNPDHPPQEIISSSQDTPAPDIPEPWLVQKDLNAIDKTNAKDVRCVSWILKNITDPEALDVAIRLAGTIRWFEDGIDAEPSYDIITSTFDTCFDSSGHVHPGSLDRAYYSARAILWIHIRAMCKGEEFAQSSFPLPDINDNYKETQRTSDLNSVFEIYKFISKPTVSVDEILFAENTPGYHQWASRALLHIYWAKQKGLHDLPAIPFHKIPDGGWYPIPMDEILDLLLVCSMFLGHPIQKEVLKIQDKTVYSDWVVSQLSLAVIAAIPASHPRHSFLGGVLSKLAEWDSRPSQLKTEAYEWCSAICEEYQGLGVVRQLLLDSLKIGSRGRRRRGWPIESAYRKRHLHMANTVFNSGDDELIRGLLRTLVGEDLDTPTLLGRLPSDLICLWLDDSTSGPKLRQLVIRSVECLGPLPGDRVGEKKFTALLNRLRVGTDEMDSKESWLKLLQRVVRSSQGRHDLPHSYWELIVELPVEVALVPPTDNNLQFTSLIRFIPSLKEDLQVMSSLEKEKEWEKLEYWSGYLWLQWFPSFNTILDVLAPTTLSLFRNRPIALQNLEQWVKRSRWPEQCSECLRSICEGREGLQVVSGQDGPSTSSAGVESEVPGRSPSPAP